MIRLWPSSLFGQVMASVAITLLVAQAVSVTLLFRAGEERRELASLTGAALQLVHRSEQAALEDALARENRRLERSQKVDERRDRPRALRGPGQGSLPRPLRYIVTEEAPITPPEFSGEGEREALFRSLLLQRGLDPNAVAVAIRRAGDDPALNAFAASRPRYDVRPGWRERPLLVAAIQREANGPWETSRVLLPQRPQGAFGLLVLQTLVIFVFLMAILFLLLRRITRPLAQLTDRVDDFSRRPDRVVQLEESGPADTRRLIAAHNAMEGRIAALLDEKDVMLGAIGHDLKTPLAALRVRIESVPDDVQRERMADSIEDITATLDDILALARVGRDGQAAETVDLAALTMAVVEEFEDLGEPVSLVEQEEQSGRLTAQVQVTWIKRALRNLIGNALRYGKLAQLSVRRDGNWAVLMIEDEGPGIPAEKIADMMEPFTRGEGSRNRSTGGAGLGLTLARAIAEHHGGELKLSNRNQSGLRAELRLPLQSASGR